MDASRRLPRLARFAPLPLAALILAACAQGGDVRSTPGTDGRDSPGTDAVLSDWSDDAPGVSRHIRAEDIPAAAVGMDPEGSVKGNVEVVPAPAGAVPKVPAGFAAEVFATGFKQPRTLRVAPNGDIFLAESGAGRVLVFRKGQGGTPTPEVFAANLDRPYGIAFVPATNPTHVYVAAANQVVRYPYRSGDAKATGPADVIIDGIPTKRHWTRDLAVSSDGERLFLSVGSASNLGVPGMPAMTPAQIRAHEATDGLGAAWGEEKDRGVVRVFDREGKRVRNYATGLRNCSGMAVQPGTGNLWCVVNERDHLGPNVTPDFMVRIEDGSFHGWPWFYLDGREDPARAGQRPDLEGKVTAPDVLFQAHSSALSVAFHGGDGFPADYRGDAFVALHGSHSRPDITGYKVVRVRMSGGRPTGAYEDFMTGFVLDNGRVWGRPAGVAVDSEGALLVSDDANGTIFRVTRNSGTTP